VRCLVGWVLLAALAAQFVIDGVRGALLTP
jgi:small neutral amino acid transporter SnatA (MarC family)